MASTPDDGMASLIRNLETSTGRPLADWVATARASGLGKHAAIVAHLKADHGLRHGYANQIAQRALAADAPAPAGDAAIGALFEGLKAPLRPIFEALKAGIDALGPDVVYAPKKAYISLRRGKQFAMIQPSTSTRLDLGLILTDPPAGRLEASRSFNAMFTHRVRLSHAAEVDSELLGWLRDAYNLA